MASEAADVVDDLLALEHGDVVTIGAEQYDWGSPYTVSVEDDVEFVPAAGEPWQARRLRLEPEDARASDREFRVAEGLAPPNCGPGYGQLTDVDVQETLVFVTSGVTSPSPTFHERKDCPSVKKADNVREVPRKNLANKEPCKRCAVDEDEADPDDLDVPPECDWLELPADVIVEDSSIERDLEEILDVVERADGWLQVHKRIAASTTSTTKDLLWQLGLRKPDGSLTEDDVLDERLAALRRCYVE